jgi:hypothetical protein
MPIVMFTVQKSTAMSVYSAISTGKHFVPLWHIIMTIDNSFVEQVDDPAMYLSLYGVLWSLGIQYK